MPLFLLLLLQVLFEPAGIGGWRSHTSFNEIRDIVSSGQNIWAASEGGLFFFAPDALTIQTLTNAEGLPENEVTALVVDGEGRIWSGFRNGMLTRTDSDGKNLAVLSADPEPFFLHDMAISGDRIFLGTEFGIGEYLISKNEIRASYRTLGIFPRNTPVRTVWLNGDRIWAGTEQGIARAALDAPNLQDPQFWENFTVSHGLPSNVINGFAFSEGAVFVATTTGIARWDEGIWLVDGLSGVNVSDLYADGQSLFAATELAVYRRERAGLWEQSGTGVLGVSRIHAGPQGLLWAGTARNGLFLKRGDSNQWESIMPNAPAGNSFSSMAFDGNGVLWVASGNSGGNGIYSFDGNIWHNFNVREGLPAGDVTSIAIDKENRIWCGTPGAGAFVFTSADGSGIEILNVYDETNRLTGSDTPAFVIVDDIGVDEIGIIWLLNRFANNGRAVVAVDAGAGLEAADWYYFSVNDGLVSNQVSAITFDNDGKVWIGTTSGAGLSVLDYNGTLENKADDTWRTYRTADGLENNVINSLSKDLFGYIWIATPLGVNYWDGTRMRTWFGLIDSNVGAVITDPMNNKWFGTSGGISMVDRDNYRYAHFTTQNSPLVDELILSLAMDEKTGKLYIGTGRGLSSVQTPYKSAGTGTDELVCHPNPFLLSEAEQVVIGDLPVNSSVRIFTAAGRLVKELTEASGAVAGSQAFWDGRDGNNQPVGSGIYLIVAASREGDVRRGKVAVIRP